MSIPDYLPQLLDKAKEKAGSDYKIAKMLHTTPQTVSNWRHGRKTCPAADVALLAAVAGLDPAEWLSRAVLAQHEGTPKGEQLSKVLGKLLVATGAALATSGASAAWNGKEAVGYLIRCILC